MEFTTAHLQFVKSTAPLLARTTINNFKQPLKTEFKKIKFCCFEIIKFHIILDYFKLLQLLSVHLPCPIFPMEDQHLYVPYDRKPLFDGR